MQLFEQHHSTSVPNHSVPAESVRLFLLCSISLMSFVFAVLVALLFIGQRLHSINTLFRIVEYYLQPDQPRTSRIPLIAGYISYYFDIRTHTAARR